MELNLEDLKKAMKKMWEPQEEAFAFAELLFNLQETCPIHGCGERDFDLMRYKCPICGLILTKN